MRMLITAKVNKAHLKELRQALQKILTENDSTEEQLKGLSNKYFQLVPLLIAIAHKDQTLILLIATHSSMTIRI